MAKKCTNEFSENTKNELVLQYTVTMSVYVSEILVQLAF